MNAAAVRIPLAEPHRFLIVQRVPITIDAHLVTIAVYSVFAGPHGEHRHLVSSVLSLTEADGGAVLAWLEGDRTRA